MILRFKKFTLKDGRVIEVFEQNWDISMTLSEEMRKASIDPLPDKRKQYFREEIYPVLFAPTSGDVPTLDEAYAMLEHDKSSEDLDGWYKIVQTVNPDWFSNLTHNKPETVTFSDRSKLTVRDANVPSGIMMIRDLEELAQGQPADALVKQVFRLTFYPKLAACSRGDVPGEEEARTMPTAELNKWYEAVNRVNPHWFQPLQKLKEEADAEALKKKRKRPRK